LLKAYGFNPLQLVFACISRTRSAVGGGHSESADGGSSGGTSGRHHGSSETDALLFNPLDEPGD
jgi:hypothetical protein